MCYNHSTPIPRPYNCTDLGKPSLNSPSSSAALARAAGTSFSSKSLHEFNWAVTVRQEQEQKMEQMKDGARDEARVRARPDSMIW